MPFITATPAQKAYFIDIFTYRMTFNVNQYTIKEGCTSLPKHNNRAILVKIFEICNDCSRKIVHERKKGS
jgi:hypothetical protein